MSFTAEQAGLRGYVDLRGGGPALGDDEAARATHGDNQWDWYFDQRVATAADAAAAYLSWQWDPEAWPEAAWPTSWPADPRLVVPRFLRPNNMVRRQAWAFFSAHGLEPARTIAVSHRSVATGAPIEAYFTTLDTLLAGDRTIRLWVKPDRPEVIETLQGRYGGRCTVMPEFAQLEAGSGYHKGLAAATLLAMFAACRMLLRNAGSLSDLSAALSHGQVFSFAGEGAPVERVATGFVGQEVRVVSPTKPALGLGEATALRADGERSVPGRAAAVDTSVDAARLLVIRERDIGLFSLFFQVVHSLAVIDKHALDRIPVVIFGRGSIYFHPSGYRGRRTTWEYYFEPLVPEWSEERVLGILGDHALELLESKRRQTEHRRGECEFPNDLGLLVPVGRRDWANVARVDALPATADWAWTDSFNPIVDGRHLGDGLSFERARDLVARHIRPRAYIEDLAATFRQRHLQGRYVIGVHVRGSDMRSCEEIPFDRYYDEIERRLATVASGAARVLLATDEESVVTRFAERFGDRLVSYDTVRRAPTGQRFGEGPTGGPIPGYFALSPDAACKNGEDCVVEYLLLRGSDALIHNGAGLAGAAEIFVPDTVSLPDAAR